MTNKTYHIQLRRMFRLEPWDHRLPESVGQVDPIAQYNRRLSRQEREDLDSLAIVPFASILRQVGRNGATELVRQLGAFMVLNDPDNCILEDYKRRKASGKMKIPPWRGCK